MHSVKHLLVAARVAAIAALAFVVLKIGPTFVHHAAGHSGTYAGVPAARAR